MQKILFYSTITALFIVFTTLPVISVVKRNIPQTFAYIGYYRSMYTTPHNRRKYGMHKTKDMQSQYNSTYRLSRRKKTGSMTSSMTIVYDIAIRKKNSNVENSGMLHTDTQNYDLYQIIRFFEDYYSLPNSLLYALTIVESGRKSRISGKYEPWPWTLNVEGTAYFFENSQNLKRFFVNTINTGVTNIDVGCGQINWVYHKHHFKHPTHIINPVYNIAYSAYLLRKHYDKTWSWDKAVSLYHSGTPKLGKAYLKKVRSVLRAIKEEQSFH